METVTGFIGHTDETILYPAQMYAKGGASIGYLWHWIACDQSRRSEHAFEFFYDCLQDARTHGFEPSFQPELAETEAESEEAPAPVTIEVRQVARGGAAARL